MKPNQTWPITKTNRRKELFQVRIQPTLRNQVREISHLTGQSLSSIAEEAFLDFIQKKPYWTQRSDVGKTRVLDCITGKTIVNKWKQFIW